MGKEICVSAVQIVEIVRLTDQNFIKLLIRNLKEGYQTPEYNLQ